MWRPRLFSIAGLAALAACALIVVGCGDDDDDSTSSTASTSTSAEAGAEQNIDSAVQSCTDAASGLGQAGAAGLTAACTTAGENAKQALSSGSADANQALSGAATSCTTKVSALPAGQAQDELTKVCDAIAGAAE
jgi:hypothetical protein